MVMNDVFYNENQSNKERFEKEKMYTDIINNKVEIIKELEKIIEELRSNNQTGVTPVPIYVDALPEFLGSNELERFLKALEYAKQGIIITKLK